MMQIIVLVLSALVSIQAGFPDNLPKCALKDEKCLKDLYQNIVQSVGEKGIPELGIPAVDPIELNNVTVSILGLIDITMIKGIATGIKTCVFQKFTFDLLKESGYQENECSIQIQGIYKLRSSSPLVEGLLQNSSIHGKGTGKVSIDKLFLKYDFPVYAQKRDDGEIYMNCDYKKIVYDYEVRGGAKFFADNIYLGNTEISKVIVPILNDNWKFIMRTFGKPFIDKAMEFYFDFAGKFFNVVPAKYYITDDLMPYARP